VGLQTYPQHWYVLPGVCLIATILRDYRLLIVVLLIVTDDIAKVRYCTLLAELTTNTKREHPENSGLSREHRQSTIQYVTLIPRGLLTLFIRLSVAVGVRFETVVKQCWNASAELRPDISAVRRNIDKFYRGPSSEHDGYYSQDEFNRGYLYMQNRNGNR